MSTPTTAMGTAVDLSQVRLALGESLYAKVRASKILVVGAGGIGCELLKNLAISGFHYVETVDLDTIDVSNLNRQFLFRKRHVGMSKATVAREAVQAFSPTMTIVAHHANILTSDFFNISYIKTFTIVINALDNLKARRHVNRLCLATDTPLIEAGSTGHNGQVSVIKKGVTECYDCTSKPTPKKFPLCTIRSTPSKPVHCVVWAKELHKLLFGFTKDSRLWEEDENESVYMTTVSERPLRGSDAEAYARAVFAAVFGAEITKKINMGKYKTAEHPPIPLDLETLPSVGEGAARTVDLCEATTSFSEQRCVWDASTCANLFVRCVAEMFRTRFDEIGKAVWSKDTRLDMCFVACATNLRAHVFGIERQSSFKVKEIAGNIIPAIATTNAVVAGLQILEVFKVLRAMTNVAKDPETGSLVTTFDDAKLMSTCRYVWVNMNSKNRKGLMLMPVELESPNKKCYVCGKSTMTVKIDTKKTSFDHFLEKVLRGALGFNQPDVWIGGSGLYESGDGAQDFCENLPKKLCDLGGGGIKHDVMVNVEDFSQGDYKLDICVYHVDEDEYFDEKKNPDKFEIARAGSTPTTRASQKRKDRSLSHEETVARSDDDGASGGNAKKVRMEKGSGVAAAKVVEEEDDHDDDDILEIQADGKEKAETPGGIIVID